MTSRVSAEQVNNLFGPNNVYNDRQKGKYDPDYVEPDPLPADYVSPNGIIQTVFIKTAHTIVNAQFVDGREEPKLAPELLEIIELYLAAHYLAITEERGALTRSYFGDAEEWLEGRIYSSGFGSTRFGQQAIALDPSGTLATVSHSTKGSAQFEVV